MRDSVSERVGIYAHTIYAHKSTQLLFYLASAAHQTQKSVLLCKINKTFSHPSLVNWGQVGGSADGAGLSHTQRQMRLSNMAWFCLKDSSGSNMSLVFLLDTMKEVQH